MSKKEKQQKSQEQPKEEQNLENKDMEQNSEQQENQEFTEDCKELQDLLKIELDKYLRLFAEYENYKRRTAKERLELLKTANQELMSALLPIVDDFERGLKEIKKVKDKNLLKGMQLIYDKLVNTLKQKGLEVVEVKKGDTFDAELHEAITQIPAPSEDLKGKIVDVVEKGYKLGDKIIRYPKVIIGQ